MTDGKQPAKRATSRKTADDHKVTVTTTPTATAGGQGGNAQALCSCGWVSNTIYQRDRFKDMAVQSVERAADKHTADPAMNDEA